MVSERDQFAEDVLEAFAAALASLGGGLAKFEAGRIAAGNPFDPDYMHYSKRMAEARELVREALARLPPGADFAALMLRRTG